MKSMLRMLAAAGVAATVLACGDTTGASTGQVVVQLTDAPGTVVQSATVWISSVYLVADGDSTVGPRYVVADTAQRYDLLNLQNGVFATLATADIPVGSYNQLRLVVDSARVTLPDSVTFADGGHSRSLTVPSGDRSGIKVNLGGAINVASGRTTIVVDFNVLQNFVFTGPSTRPTGVLFTPVLHGAAMSEAGSIAGTVTPASAQATITAILGTDTVALATADTATGAYLIKFLPPGAYTLVAEGTNLSATKTLTLRAAQDTTGVDFP